VFVTTNVFTNPGAAMNIEDDGKGSGTLRLVDGGLKRLPVHLKVFDVACPESYSRIGQAKCTCIHRRGQRCCPR
jgi:hypothetical protein